MAPALRVSLPTTRLIGIGGLGRAVTHELCAALPGAQRLPLDAGPRASLPATTARLQVLASWRAEPALTAELDAWAFATGGWWLPVIAEPPAIRVGPAVVPGEGACHACYAARVRQHDLAPELIDALERHYERDPAAGPAGFLPPLATLAAGLALGTLAALAADPAAVAGRVHRFDVVQQRTTRGRAVGVHGCPRCGLGRDEALRSHAALASDVAEALAA